MSETEIWTIWADGSGTTGGPAGIGFYAENEFGAPMSGSLPLRDATNQQAEILAAAYALTQIAPNSVVTIISDSEYLIKGWNEYLPYWRTHDWRKKSGGTPKNIPYWQRLIRAVDQHMTVMFTWTRGHAGTHGNEEADRLAGLARQQALDEARGEAGSEFEVDGELVRITGERTVQIKSSSQDVWYDVAISPTSCQCQGWLIRKTCRHVELMTKWHGRWPSS